VVAFENDTDRWVAEWGELLELGELERRPYVCSGLVALGGNVGTEILRLLDDRQRRVDMDRTFYGRNDPGYAFLYPEQDVLNAVLATDRAGCDRTAALDYRLAPMPPFDGLTIRDENALSCSYRDGVEPFLVHHFGEKPWLRRLDDGVYSRLLRRSLTGPGTAVAPRPRTLPARLRRGPLAALERSLIDARYWLEWHLVAPARTLMRRLARRLRDTEAKLAGPRLLRRFADAYPEAVFVEIGSNDGRAFDPLREHIRAKQWRGVMVEPVPHVFERLRETYGGSDRIELENSAIAEHNGSIDFHHLVPVNGETHGALPEWYDAVGSLSREHVLAQARDLEDPEARVATVEVPCLTFESLCRRHGLERIDLLLVDVEGQDRMVIDSVDLEAHRPRLIVYEHRHLSDRDRRACRERLERSGYGVMEEAFDTYCLDATVADALTAFWETLDPVVRGVSQTEWERFVDGTRPR
jgi:FkbM family methyltransferase